MLEQTAQVLTFLTTIFLPGYAMAMGFLPGLDKLEKIAFSFGLGIAFIPLLLFLESQLLGIPINQISAVATAGFLAILGAAAYYYRKRKG